MEKNVSFFSLCMCVCFDSHWLCPQVSSPTGSDSASSSKALDKFEGLSDTENFDELLKLFKENCKARQTKLVYPTACHEASLHVKDPRSFLKNFLS